MDTETLIAAAQVTVGPILIGTFFNLMLFGVSVAQFYFYIQSYSRDQKWIKTMMIILFFLDLLNTILLMIFTYDALINKFGQVEAVSRATWIISTDPIITAFIGMIVQSFFAWRVKVLTRKTWIAVILIGLAILCNGGGMATGITIAGWIRVYQDFYKFKIQVIIWLVASVMCDCSITAVLVWHLRSHKTGLNNTDDIVDRIIRMTVQTGMVTSILAIIDLAVYLRWTEGYHIAFNFMLAKLYTNSLLSSLNSRSGWAFGSSSDPSGNRGPSSGTRGNGRVQTEVSRTQVFVNVESHAMADDSVFEMDQKAERDPEDKDAISMKVMS